MGETDRVAGAIAGQGGAVDQPTLCLRMGEIKMVYYPESKVDITLGGASGNELIPRVPHLSNYRPQINDPVWVLVNGPDLLVIDRTSMQGPSVISDADSAIIYTSESRTSTAWGDLVTPGPSRSSVAISPSGRLLVGVGGYISNDSGTGGAAMSVLIQRSDGLLPAYSSQPDFSRAFLSNRAGAQRQIGGTRTIWYKDIPPGEYTVTVKYASIGGGTARFQYRDLQVIPL